jgi:hypothetical protein
VPTVDRVTSRATASRAANATADLRRGGTTQYQVWAGDGPLEDIIAKDAPLYDEPRHLLREGEGIRDPGTYLSILRAIANGSLAARRLPATIAPRNRTGRGSCQHRQMTYGQARARNGRVDPGPFPRHS